MKIKNYIRISLQIVTWGGGEFSHNLVPFFYYEIRAG